MVRLSPEKGHSGARAGVHGTPALADGRPPSTPLLLEPPSQAGGPGGEAGGGAVSCSLRSRFEEAPSGRRQGVQWAAAILPPAPRLHSRDRGDLRSPRPATRVSVGKKGATVSSRGGGGQPVPENTVRAGEGAGGPAPAPEDGHALLS